MGLLTVAEFEQEVLFGLGNRTDIATDRLVRWLNLGQSRISRGYDFMEMSQVGFAQMNFTGDPAVDKYMVPPPRTKTIHSFVLLDTSSAVPNNTSPPVPPAPSLSSVSGGTLLGATYYVVLTYTGPYIGGEGAPSGQSSLAVASGNLLQVASPPATGAAIGYNVYAALNPSGFTLQNAVPVLLGNPWTMPVNGLINGAPLLNTTGQQQPIGSLGQSRKVVEKPWRWFDAHYPAPEWLPAGWPSIYKRFGNIITMVPPPFLQFTAQISFTQYATPLSATQPTQRSDFENKDDLLICYALAFGSKLLGRPDRASYFEGLAKEQLDEAIERDDTRPDLEVSRDIPAIAGAPMGPYWADPWAKNSP